MLMPRTKCRRAIQFSAEVTYFKPAGIPLRILDDVVIEADEMEAIRLADLENMYQEDAAKAMEISRQTFGRIIASARKKIADALVNGKAIRVGGEEL
jgi:predicted DNA-binding protein (UPF0251 family)